MVFSCLLQIMLLDPCQDRYAERAKLAAKVLLDSSPFEGSPSGS